MSAILLLLLAHEDDNEEEDEVLAQEADEGLAGIFDNLFDENDEWEEEPLVVDDA